MKTVRQSLNIICALTVVLAGCRGWESEEPPVHLNPNMDTQEKGRPYRADTSGLFADGRVMQTPPEGTVAQGQFIDDVAFTDGMDPASPDKPFKNLPDQVKIDGAVDPELVAHGKLRANIYCAPCHGINGDGKGTVADKGLVVPPPAFTSDRVKMITNGQIYAAIQHGVNNGNMPSYARQIPVRDRWAIVAAIRELQGLPLEGVEGAVVAAVATASAEHGQQLYTARGCSACHTTDGSRLVGPSFKGIYGKTEQTSAGPVTVNDAYILESMATPLAKVVEGYPPAMPPFAGPELEKQSLILFIQSLK